MANSVLKAWQDALPMYFWSKNHNCLLKWIDIHRISGWFCVGGKSNQVYRYLTPTQNIDIVKGGASTYDDGAVFVWDIQTACRIGWQEFLWIDFIFQILFCCFFICCLNISCDRLEQILFRWPTNPRTNSWKTHPFYSKFQFPGHELGRSMENSSTYQIWMSFPGVGQTNDREIEMSGNWNDRKTEIQKKTWMSFPVYLSKGWNATWRSATSFSRHVTTVSSSSNWKHAWIQSFSNIFVYSASFADNCVNWDFALSLIIEMCSSRAFRIR